MIYLFCVGGQLEAVGGYTVSIFRFPLCPVLAIHIMMRCLYWPHWLSVAGKRHGANLCGTHCV